MATRTWEGATSGDYGVAGNWVEGAVPIAGDDVRVPATSTQAITASLDQSGVSLGSFASEAGAPAMGTETAYLKIASSGTIRLNGSAVSYIDVGATAVVFCDGSSTPATGLRGLYLNGSAMTTLTVNGGHVGLAWRAGETSTATTIRVSGSSTTLWTGSGVTNTTFTQENGTSSIWHGGTTININGGVLTTYGTGTWTTVNEDGGIFYPNSTGTIGSGFCNSGTWNTSTSAALRTCTSFRLNPTGILVYNPAIYTISNWTAPTSPIVLTTTRPVTV